MRSIHLATLAFVCLFAFTITKSQTIHLQESFDTGSLPSGWSKLSLGSPSAGWEFGSSLGSSGFPVVAFDGSYAIVNDDLHDNASGTANIATEERLTTPSMNLAGAPEAILEFDYYMETDAAGSGKFQVSSDGGSTWPFTFFLSEYGYWRHFYFPLMSYGANTIIRFVWSDGGTLAKGFAIDNVTVTVPAEREGEIERPYTSGLMPQSGGWIGGKFRSNGLDTIHQIGVAYSVDGGSPVAGTVTGLSVGMNGIAPFTHPFPLSFTSLGPHSIRMWLTDLNGMGPDALPTNDTVTWTVKVLPTLPDRHPVVEDFTGAWCSLCADGNLRFEQALEAYPQSVGMAIHSYDMMDSSSIYWTGYRMTDWLCNGAFPSGVVDHYKFPENAGTDFFPSALKMHVHERSLMYEPASATVTSATWNASTRQITGTVTVEFFDTLTGDYRVNLFVALDSLSGNGTGWDQANSANTFPGHPYFGLGDPILDYEHQHVMISALGAEFGRPGIVPTTVYPGSSYSATFTLALPSIFWGASMQEDSITPEIVNLVGAIQQFDAADAHNRRILNASQSRLLTLTSTTESEEKLDFELYPNPSTGSLLVASYGTADAVEFILINSQGTTMHRSVLPPLAHSPALIPTKELSSGVYTAMIRNSSGEFAAKTWVLVR